MVLDIPYRDGGNSQNHPLYPGFKQEVKTLPRGSVHKEGALALPCDILYERDVAVRLRDGVTIYTDIYRPPNAPSGSTPAIVCAGPFGKNGGVNRKLFGEMPWRAGVPQSTVSSLEKFEGLDPAYWVHHGYAIIHPDVRGSWRSEGAALVNGTLDGQDGYDLVEWLAEQSWSNGKVSYAGNSWLSQTQWFIGAERPPHLACLAPWEGWHDLYNDDVMRGGIPVPGFQQFLLDNCSPNLDKVEDIAAAAAKYPEWNEFWDFHRAKVESITVPMYVTASWTNMLHTRGTFKGYLQSSSAEKWLRVHNSHEWPDLYYPQNVEDLRKFFDCYLKGIENDWKFTPKVRLCVLNPGGNDVVNRPEGEFPLAREVQKKLYLDPSNSTLRMDKPLAEATSIKFDAKDGEVTFEYTFSEDTELTGFFSLHLWVEVIGHDDLDIYAQFWKLSGSGELLEKRCIDVGFLQQDPEAEWRKLEEVHRSGDPGVALFFAGGATGMHRASHRELDEAKSTLGQPVYTHRKEQKLKPGEIVPVLVELWPHGMKWAAGEKLRLTVAGHHTWPTQLPVLRHDRFNKGEAVLHAGGQYDSFLLVPFIPKA